MQSASTQNVNAASQPDSGYENVSGLQIQNDDGYEYAAASEADTLEQATTTPTDNQQPNEN